MFSLALVMADFLNRGDCFSVALAQPLRAYAGALTVDAVTTVDQAGRQLRTSRQWSMVPEARETMTELNYPTATGPSASLALVLTLRRHPDHLADAATEKLLAMRLARQF